MSSSEKGPRKDDNEKRLPPDVEEKLRKLKFQNYIPRSDALKPYCDNSFDPDEAFNELVTNYNEVVRSSNIKFMDPALDLNNLVPKKANIEMKQALNQKLERLNRRTKRAIVEIARKKQIEDGELIGAVDVQQQVSSDEEGA